MRENEKFVRFNGLVLRIIKKITSGGMADIVLCEEVTSKMKFVLKSQKTFSSNGVPIKENSKFNNDERYNHFREEVVAYVKLIHQNIVDFYGFEIVRGLPRILLSYVEGGTLHDWISKNKCDDLQIALKILIQIAKGMKFAHERGLIHRDLKPSNILMKTNQENTAFICKVSDFGIVKISHNKMGRSKFGDSVNTSNGTPLQDSTPIDPNDSERISFISEAIGTPGYGSPEQFGLVSSKIDQNVDLFSFGVIAAELLTNGHRPKFYFWYRSSGGIVFDPKSVVKDAQMIIKDHFSKYEPKCPPSLIRLITKCVEIDPCNRWKQEKVAGTFSYFDTILKQLIEIYESLFGDYYYWVSDSDTVLNEDLRYVLRAKTLKNLGESESEVKKFFDYALNITPRSFLEWSNKSKFLLDFGKNDEALKTAEKSISLNSKFVLAWYNKGNALDEIGRKEGAIEAYEGAIEAYDKAIEIDPTFGLSYYYKAKTLARLRRYYEALDAFCKAIEFDEFDINSWYDKEKLLFDLQLYDEALKALEKITEIDPYHSSSWFRKGEVLQALNRIDDALKCYDKVIEIEGNSFDALENKGTLLRLKVQECLARSGPNTLLTARNRLLELLGEAERSYGKALEVKPDDPIGHLKLAALFIQRSLIDDRSKEFFINKGLTELKIAVEKKPQLKEAARRDISFKSVISNHKFHKIVGAE